MTERIPIQQGRKILQARATHVQIQSAVTDYLAVRRIPHSVTDATESHNRDGHRVRRVEEGWPDVTGCLPGLRSVSGLLSGIFLAVEVKTAKDKLRPAQAKVLHTLYQAGALVVVARSVDDLVAALETGKASDETLAEIADVLVKEGKPKSRQGPRANTERSFCREENT